MPRGVRMRPDGLDLAVSAILSRQRHHRPDVSQTSLAKAVGVSQPTVSKILSGQKAVTLAEYERFCDALGLDWMATLVEATASLGRPYDIATLTGRDVKA